MYRPTTQGPAPLDFLTEYMDDLLSITGDLNAHIEEAASENLLAVQGLTDHVNFPTDERGGTLNPVISDLGEDDHVPPALTGWQLRLPRHPDPGRRGCGTG